MNLMNDNHIAEYTRALKFRYTFKKIQQLSWTISKIEQRFNLENMNNNDLIVLNKTYQDLGKELISISNELNNENTNNSN